MFPVLRLGRRMRKISNSTQQQLGAFAAQLDETFQGVRMVKAYGREEHEIFRARTIIEKLYTLYFGKASRVQAAGVCPSWNWLGARASAWSRSSSGMAARK